MPDPLGPLAAQAAEFSARLRLFLRGRPEPPHVQASAMAYELTALAARAAPTKADALLLIAAWAEQMRRQILELGVDEEHP